MLKNLTISNNDKDIKFDILNKMNKEIDLPLPCKEIKDNYGNYNFYCIALILLWFMLIVSSVLYQLRAIINIKNKITQIPNSVKPNNDNNEHNAN